MYPLHIGASAFRPKEGDESYLRSAESTNNPFQSVDEYLDRLETLKQDPAVSVERKNVQDLRGWSLVTDDRLTALRHESGRFFSVEGIHVSTSIGPVREWDQPIIVQPEYGVLGVISMVQDGVRYFLMQAKMEPGCVNAYQVSPTVQATKSNYSRVHRGRLPPYIEYFLDREKQRVLFSYLLSEQTTRFLHKRNLNMHVEVDEAPPLLPGFSWLTLNDLKSLYPKPCIVNMNTRSVLACLDVLQDVGPERLDESVFGEGIGDFQAGLYREQVLGGEPIQSVATILSRLSRLRAEHQIGVARKPLDRLDGWTFSGGEIVHDTGEFFSIIGVEVRANREVTNWDQPLVAQPGPSMIGLLVAVIGGLHHFLFQAKLDAGCSDALELAPTVACSVPQYRMEVGQAPPFLELFTDDGADYVLDTVLSEEGGRFYRNDNIYRIRRTTPDELGPLPPNYLWISYTQIYDFVVHGHFTVESRTLISYLI